MRRLGRLSMPARIPRVYRAHALEHARAVLGIAQPTTSPTDPQPAMLPDPQPARADLAACLQAVGVLP